MLLLGGIVTVVSRVLTTLSATLGLHSLLSILGKIFFGHLLGRNETIMFLLIDNHPLFPCFKNEQYRLFPESGL